MKILSMDTSTPHLSLAIFEKEKLLAEWRSEAGNRHSEILIPAIQKILNQVKWKARDLQCVVVGLGPGSFTGIRVGVTTAKTLSYAIGCKLIGVPSLEAIARESIFEGKAAVLVDAKRNQFYAAVYEKKSSGTFRQLTPPRLLPAQALEKVLRKVKNRFGEGLTPQAQFLAQSAFEKIKLKKFDSLKAVQPLYLYPKDCNVTPRRKK